MIKKSWKGKFLFHSDEFKNAFCFVLFSRRRLHISSIWKVLSTSVELSVSNRCQRFGVYSLFLIGEILTNFRRGISMSNSLNELWGQHHPLQEKMYFRKEASIRQNVFIHFPIIKKCLMQANLHALMLSNKVQHIVTYYSTKCLHWEKKKLIKILTLNRQLWKSWCSINTVPGSLQPDLLLDCK